MAGIRGAADGGSLDEVVGLGVLGITVEHQGWSRGGRHREHH